MDVMYGVEYGDSISHHGILGMRWGIRRTPEELGHARLKNAKSANLDAWGKSKDTNVLYVTGLSGSGKSTASLALADKNTSVLHLDLFFDTDIDKNISFNNESLDLRFVSFLRNKMPDYRNVYDKNVPKQERRRYYDRFASVIEDFGRKEFESKRKVIAEGIQVADGTLYTSPEMQLKNKPIIFLQTSPVESFKRAGQRDGDGRFLLQQLAHLNAPMEKINWYYTGNKEYARVANAIGAKRQVVQHRSDNMDVMYGVVYDPNYLAHYGVLGMKWGVRKNPSRAYAKSVKKADGLERKAAALNETSGKTDYSIAKAKHRARKIRAKAAKARRKGDKAAQKGDTDRALRLYNKADKYERKFSRLDSRAANNDWVNAKRKKKARKLTKKRDKWLAAMETNFSTIRLQDIDPEVRERGKKYLYTIGGK